MKILLVSMLFLPLFSFSVETYSPVFIKPKTISVKEFSDRLRKKKKKVKRKKIKRIKTIVNVA